MIITETPDQLLTRLHEQLAFAPTLCDAWLRAGAYKRVIDAASVHISYNHDLAVEERDALIAVQRIADALRETVIAEINAQPLPDLVRR